MQLISDVRINSLCISQIALTLEQLSLCENIPVPDVYISCFKEIGIKLNDPTVCALMKKANTFTNEDKIFKDVCFYGYAQKNHDQKICSSIFYDDYRSQCQKELKWTNKK